MKKVGGKINVFSRGRMELQPETKNTFKLLVQVAGYPAIFLPIVFTTAHSVRQKGHGHHVAIKENWLAQIYRFFR